MHLENVCVVEDVIAKFGELIETELHVAAFIDEFFEIRVGYVVFLRHLDEGGLRGVIFGDVHVLKEILVFSAGFSLSF